MNFGWGKRKALVGTSSPLRAFCGSATLARLEHEPATSGFILLLMWVPQVRFAHKMRSHRVPWPDLAGYGLFVVVLWGLFVVTQVYLPSGRGCGVFLGGSP